MIFNSYGFILIFMPIALSIALLLRGQRLLIWISAASFAFYGFAGHVWFLIPMLVTTVLDFCLAPLIEKAPRPRRFVLLLISLCGNLGLLAYFKYGGLLARSAVVLTGVGERWTSLFDVVLPAGISFYTFQTLSYVIDVYRGHCPAERKFFKFAGFVSFFPHLVAGPLTRHHQLIPSLERIARTGIKARWREGLLLFTIGLAKKVLIADRFALIADSTIGHVGSSGAVSAWIALLSYSLQIYFDFSGYSDMAIGLGRLFSIELPQNFNSPYKAVSPADFWTRWHMTLSAWLKDYLYIPLGGSRCSARRRNLNLMLTMGLGGLWHGASWTFALWGIYHGTLLIAFHTFEKRWCRLPVILKRAITFFLISLGWVPFRAVEMRQMLSWCRALSGLNGISFEPGHAWPSLALIGMGLALVNFTSTASPPGRLLKLSRIEQCTVGVIAAVAFMFLGQSNTFLYFQF